jgi:hypothetical protein
VLAGSGYVSEENFARAGTDGLRLLAPLAKDPDWHHHRAPRRTRHLVQYAATARATRRMRHHRGKEDYKLRSPFQDPEPAPSTALCDRLIYARLGPPELRCYPTACRSIWLGATPTPATPASSPRSAADRINPYTVWLSARRLIPAG